MEINQLLGYSLIVLLAVPVVLAIVIVLTGRNRPTVARGFAVYGSTLQLLLTLIVAILNTGFTGQSDRKLGWNPKVVAGDAGMRGDTSVFSGTTNWNLLTVVPVSDLDALRKKNVPDPAIQFFVGLDGVNVVLLVLTSLLFFLSVVVSWGTVRDRAASYYAWLFVLQAAITGAFLSFDIILFYVFFELTLIPSFFLIGQFGTGSGPRDAAKKFVLYTLFGSLLTLIGIIGVVLSNPTAMHPQGYHAIFYAPEQSTLSGSNDATVIRLKPGTITFSIPYLIRNVNMWDSDAHNGVVHAKSRLERATPQQQSQRQQDLKEAQDHQASRRGTQFWIFLALIAGFAVKIPIIPFHTWLPAAYGEAPLPVTMIFSAVMAKLGTFGILRIVIPLVPEMAVQYGLPWFGTLGAIGIVYAAFCAYAQKDLKLLAAYSSVSHLGFLVVGLFAMNHEGFAGAVLHMFNHGLTAGALFALLVFLSRRYRSLDANQYGGLWSKYPRFAFFLIFIGLASVGVPGLNSFVSEMLMLAGMFDSRNVKIVGYGIPIVAAVGILLSSWYTMTMIRRVLFGQTLEPLANPEPNHESTDLHGREFVPAFIFAALCLLLGLFPQPVLNIIQPDIESVTAVISNARARLDPTAIPPDFEEQRRRQAENRANQPRGGQADPQLEMAPGGRGPGGGRPGAGGPGGGRPGAGGPAGGRPGGPPPAPLVIPQPKAPNQ